MARKRIRRWLSGLSEQTAFSLIFYGGLTLSLVTVGSLAWLIFR